MIMYPIRQSAKKIISIFVAAASIVLLPDFVFASSADGSINSVYKYAWSENIGWINFNLDGGNIHITDSGISGYGWSSNYGWINLNPSGSGVKNNGAGALSGSAWGINTGWIDFSGVSIDSNGYFSGYASGDVTGRISFNCSNTNSCAFSDFKVQTDWRPQSVRPLCNNSIDDDEDGLIDYPNDLGCESLEDDNEINPSAGISHNLPAKPLRVLINNGDEYTNSKDVVLKLYGGSDIENISISNSPDFSDVSQIPYQDEIKWKLEVDPASSAGQKSIKSKVNAEHTVYVKFYTKYGKASDIVSDAIILDTVAPDLKVDNIKDYYREDEDIILTGKTERDSEVILHWDKKYSLIQVDSNGYWKINLGKMPAGDYILDVTSKDLAGSKSRSEIIELTVNLVGGKVKEEIVGKETSKEGAGAKKIQEEIVNVPTKPPVGKPTGELPQAKAETILEKIEKAADKIINRIIDIIKPSSKTPKQEETQIVTIPEEPSLVFQKKWCLLPREAINRFALAPLPIEFKKLAEKFPKLGKTFEQVGVKKITDLNKLESVKLTLPGLSERAGIPSGEIKTGEIAIIRPVPLAKLSSQIKQQLPTEIIFANTGGELIDFNIALSINKKGKPQQKISTISGKQLHLVVKPDKPVKTVKGYVVFKSRNLETWNLKLRTLSLNLNDLLNSTLFALPAFAQTAADVNYILLC